MPNGPPSSARTASCQPLDGSTAASKAGSASRRTARSLFEALVFDRIAKSRCDASILSEAAAGASSATSRSVQGMPAAVRAITSASIASVLAVTGNMSRAFFIAIPGRYETGLPLARALATTSAPMLRFWSTTTLAAGPASASARSMSAGLLATSRLNSSSPAAPTAQAR